MSVSQQEAVGTNSTGTRIVWFYIVIAVVALVGLADATYLTIEHLSGRALQCSLTSGCGEVLSSEYSKLFGLPVSGIGAFAYFVVFSIAILIVFDYRWLKPFLLVIVTLMALASCFFIYLQAFVIKHYCQYCLLSAAVCFTLFAMTFTAGIFEKRKS
jgi:uncharacterized membrane protein